MTATATNSRPLEYFLSHLHGVIPNGANSWKALCPVHEADGLSHNPSLVVTEADDGKVLVYCHVCKDPKIGVRCCGIFGIAIRSLWPEYQRTPSRGAKTPKGEIERTYSYRLQDESLLFQVVRYKPKDFSQRRPDGNGGWINNMKGIKLVPYQLPQIIKRADDDIFCPEGEKDVLKLQTNGFLATCNAGGASKWKATPEMTEPFRDRNVIMLPDNDAEGEKHAVKVATILSSVAKSVKILRLLGLPPKGDVSDWFEAGGTAEQLKQLAAEAPLFVPGEADKPGPVAPKKQLPVLSNLGPNPKGEFTLPLSMGEILANVNKLTGGWPRRVGKALFTPGFNEGVSWIDSPEALMGYVGHVTGHPPVFATAAGRHTKREVFAELQRTAQSYLAVETVIHEPPLPDHFYINEVPSPGNGEHLAWLLDRFSPETDVDRDLIQAALMTLVWGGPGGLRPAFVFTADEGRGSGKSKAVAMLSEVIGGHIEISSNEDVGVIRQRLLSPEGLSKRLAVLDNVKSHKFSWGELEGLITAGFISGKRMYVGEAQRPNTICWFITLNGVSLSTDLAQRCVVIKLKKPKFNPLWEEQTRAHIREHRAEIIADLVAALQEERTPLTRFSRWNGWEWDVLSRLPDPAEAQKVIAERQQVADVECEESEIIEGFFSQKLQELGYDIDADCVFVPSVVSAAWVGAALSERLSTTAASRKVSQLINEGSVQRIGRASNKALGRGFYWNGANASPAENVQTDIEFQIEDRKARVSP